MTVRCERCERVVLRVPDVDGHTVVLDPHPVPDGTYVVLDSIGRAVASSVGTERHREHARSCPGGETMMDGGP